jgi:outer membrane protein assembly factor BamB
MLPAARRFRTLQSHSFWLALLFWLTYLHLPSFFEAALAIVFVGLVWQLSPRTKWTAIGLSFAIWLGLSLTTQLLLLALPKAMAWSWLSSSTVRIPAQVGYVAPLGSVGSWIVFVATALLRYYDCAENSKGGVRLRFVIASTIVWASFSLAGETLFAAPVSGLAANFAPLVSLPLFLAFPASFLFWRFKGRSWIARCLVAFAALRAVSLAYVVAVWALMFTRAMMLTVPLYIIAIAVTSRAWQPQSMVVGILWAGVAAYLRSTTDEGAGTATDSRSLRSSPLLPVLVCAIPALAVAFSIDAQHRIAEAKIEAEKVARGARNQQKLAAMLKWRLVLPREEPTSLVILQPPVVGPDGSAYVVARKESQLHAVDSSGQLKWSFPGVIAANPVVSPHGTVYVVGSAHTLFALDEKSGQTRWSTQFSNGLDLICTGPALAADGTVYTVTQRNSSSLQLNALTPDGKLLWQLTEPSEKMCSIRDVPEMAPQVLPPPVVASDGTIYFTHEATLYAVDPRGTEKWTAPTEGPIARLLLGKHGEVYTYAEKLTAFDANGRRQWTSPWRTALWLHPDIGEDGTIYLVDATEYTRKLVAINPDGSEKWTFAGDSAIQAVAAGSDGIIYVYAGNGALYALNAQHDRLDWGYGSTIASCVPAVAPDGSVYAATFDGEFFALHPPSRLILQSSQAPR